MRFRLFLICGLLIAAPISGLAQLGCGTLRPCFCDKMRVGTGASAGDCEAEIQADYSNLLKIAANNWKFIKDLNFAFAPVSPDSKRKYGRCIAENTEIPYAGGYTQTLNLDSLSFLDLRQFVIGVSEPLPVETPHIRLDENQQDDYGEFVKNEQKYLTHLGQLVGRLEIRYRQPSSSIYKSDCAGSPCQEYPGDEHGKISYAQWGTAIQVADNVIVTSCHELESFVEKDDQGGYWKLKPMEQYEDLRVDFGERDDQFDPSDEFKVAELLWLPEEEGFDVAVLKIEPANNSSKERPSLKQFKFGEGANPGQPNKREVAVIGYPDFHHPLDPCAEAAFGPYKTQGDAKFVSLGCAQDISSMNSCAAKDKGILLHDATTTMGESGSIVVDRQNKTVIGLHVCCSYPQNDTYTQAPRSQLNCANLKRTQYNQAISVCRLFNSSAKDSKGKTFRDIVPRQWWPDLHCAESDGFTRTTKHPVQK